MRKLIILPLLACLWQPLNAQDTLLATYSRFDFVPGEKVIYAEDFASDATGELPVNWNTNANGSVIAMADKSKWLHLAVGNYLSGTKAKDFGPNFTVEFDMLLNVVPKMGYYLPPLTFGLFASGKEDPGANPFLTHQFQYNSFSVKIDPKENENTMARIHSYENKKETFFGEKKVSKYGATLRKVAHYAISVQGTRLRIWINEDKVFDLPRGVNTSTPFNQLYFRVETTGGFPDEAFQYLVGNIKVAAGLPDTRSKLVTTGKFSTTGILFDVNSDKIKATSHGTLKEIAAVLTENPELKVKIVGHTDADGVPAANVALSKKRAEAVKTYLVEQFGIDATLLSTDGKGASVPVGDNKTVLGKANNRRVEFVKI
ncbi:OmpA family protein [Chitinophaga horti]|uniref:OmpA family protein n=1 Tax=Chitinophaga horti TaxID=2920382 RepID=A0ABY6J3H7_9BACT|nr:OmpA family protein [Chitinophaga horti]UYQ94138.1 OmpA family protein [Chitinophaga horti]